MIIWIIQDQLVHGNHIINEWQTDLDLESFLIKQQILRLKKFNRIIFIAIVSYLWNVHEAALPN